MDAEGLLVASSIYARFLLGGVFLWAGIAKMRDLAAFERSIQAFDLIRRQWVAMVARVIPLLESCLGVLLILGLGMRWSAIAALLTIGVFTLAILIMLVRGQAARCFCFGNSGAEGDVGRWTIYRNLGLMLLAGIVIASPTTILSVDALITPRPMLALPLNHAVVGGALSSAAILIWLVIGEALRYRGYG